jgi:hypothetical protein
LGWRGALIRAFLAVESAVDRLMRRACSAYVHDIRVIESRLVSAGFGRVLSEEPRDVAHRGVCAPVGPRSLAARSDGSRNVRTCHRRRRSIGWASHEVVGQIGRADEVCAARARCPTSRSVGRTTGPRSKRLCTSKSSVQAGSALALKPDITHAVVAGPDDQPNRFAGVSASGVPRPSVLVHRSRSTSARTGQSQGD